MYATSQHTVFAVIGAIFLLSVYCHIPNLRPTPAQSVTLMRLWFASYVYHAGQRMGHCACACNPESRKTRHRLHARGRGLRHAAATGACRHPAAPHPRRGRHGALAVLLGFTGGLTAFLAGLLMAVVTVTVRNFVQTRLHKRRDCPKKPFALIPFLAVGGMAMFLVG